MCGGIRILSVRWYQEKVGEAWKVQLKLQWKIQGHWRCLIHRIITEKSCIQCGSSPREALWAVDSRAGGMELPIILLPRWFHQWLQTHSRELQDVVFSLLDLNLTLFWSFLDMPPFLLFGIRVLVVFYFELYGEFTDKRLLESQKRYFTYTFAKCWDYKGLWRFFNQMHFLQEHIKMKGI